MAMDEREYPKKKHGWMAKNLTVFKRSAKPMEETQYDDLIEQSAREVRRRVIVAVIAIGLITLGIIEFTGWSIFGR